MNQLMPLKSRMEASTGNVREKDNSSKKLDLT